MQVHQLRRSFYSIIKRKTDRDVASVPLAQRRSAEDEDRKGLRLEIDRLEQGSIRGTSASFAALLQSCVAAKALREGIRLHEVIVKAGLDSDTYIGNHLVQMYGSCGQVQEARKVFDEISHRNVFSWNILMMAYAQNGHLQDAKITFDRMLWRDVVSWTGMITAFAQNGYPERALELFKLMDVEGVPPSGISLLSALDACALVARLVEGREIHDSLRQGDWKNNVKIGTALVSMYGACGSLLQAREVFERMPGHNVITWNALIASYARNGCLEEAECLLSSMPDSTVSSWNAVMSGYSQAGDTAGAFLHFQKMDLCGLQADTITLVTILDLCANETRLRLGKLIHSSITNDDEGLELDGPLKTALLCLYGRCGSLLAARNMFEAMWVHEKSVVAWSAIIAVHAQNGHPEQAVELLQCMALDGGMPNEITFHSLLCACRHSGLLEVARKCFVDMVESYYLKPGLEHFVCMVDVLGRAGHIADAEELARSMPFAADKVAWTAVLGACKTQGDISRGRNAAGRVLGIKPGSSSAYVLLDSTFRT